MSDDFGFMVDRSTGNDPMGMKARLGVGIPDLVAVLWSEYRKHIAKQYKEMKAQGSKMRYPTPEETARKAPAEDFVKFATKFLDVNRPTQQFPVDNNVGIVLRNLVRCSISPNTQIPGQMQDSGAVQVTTGESQPGLDGMQDPGGSVGIT